MKVKHDHNNFYFYYSIESILLFKNLPKSCDLIVWNGKIQTTCRNILSPHQNSPAPAVFSFGLDDWPLFIRLYSWNLEEESEPWIVTRQFGRDLLVYITSGDEAEPLSSAKKNPSAYSNMDASKPILFYDIASRPPATCYAPNPWKTR